MGFFANMYLTESGAWLHRWIGYLILLLILGRILWGFLGTSYARFSSFFPTPSNTLTYIKQLLRKREPRYIGHNPAGAWMMVILILTMTSCIVTGWMQGLDVFWGISWIQTVHEFCADAILVLAALHVAGAIFTSFRHRENLIWSMITGYKHASDPETDSDHENSPG